VCSTSEMHGPLRMRERRAGLFYEETPGIREFHNPSLVASEQSRLGFRDACDPASLISEARNSTKDSICNGVGP
jgi:hypothetical protein